MLLDHRRASDLFIRHFLLWGQEVEAPCAPSACWTYIHTYSRAVMCPPGLTQEALQAMERKMIHHAYSWSFSHFILSIKVTSRPTVTRSFHGQRWVLRWVYALPAPRRCGMGSVASWPLMNARWDLDLMLWSHKNQPSQYQTIWSQEKECRRLSYYIFHYQ